MFFCRGCQNTADLLPFKFFDSGMMNEGFPKPAASTQGTMIVAEDLFYNVPLRRKALKSPSEEYNAILDVVGKYAVFKAGAAVAVKRTGSARADLSTMEGSSRMDTIRAIYGNNIAKNIVPFHLNSGFNLDDEPLLLNGRINQLEPHASIKTSSNKLISSQNISPNHVSPSEILRCKVEGFITGADYAGKVTKLILFINGRSVDFPPLKRCMEATYASLLPKAAKPWIFLDVRMPATDVDVNVHPTKKEVAFLHQEDFIERLRVAVEETLFASNAQRSFKQALLPGAVHPLPLPNEIQTSQSYRPDKLVRTDRKTQTLDTFFSSIGETNKMQHVALDPILGHVNKSDLESENSHVYDKNTIKSIKTSPQDGKKDRNLYKDAFLASASMPPRRKARPEINTKSKLDNFAFLPTPMEISGAISRNPMKVLSAEDSKNVERLEVEEIADNQTQTVMNHTSKENVGTKAIVTPMSTQFSDPVYQRLSQIIETLTEKMENKSHDGLSELLHSMIYVGIVDSRRCLVQSGTRLCLIDLNQITNDLFYQRSLRLGSRASQYVLEPPLSIYELALTALEAEEIAGTWCDADAGDNKEDIANLLKELLIQKSDLLFKCFSIMVTEDGMIETLPMLLDKYQPPLHNLPAFVLGLGQNVDWKDESNCVDDVARLIGDLYSFSTKLEVEENDRIEYDGNLESSYASLDDISNEDRAVRKQYLASLDNGEVKQQVDREAENLVMNVIIPALRTLLVPCKSRAIDGSIIELTRLEHLYKVFERC